MDQKTVTKLNQLNQDFYQQIAESFDQTRQSAWKGWRILVPTLLQISKDSKTFSVLDFGCGNGRFAEFLLKNSFNFEYLGVDNNKKLLNIAQKKFDTKQKVFFSQQDLIELIISSQLQSKINQQFDLVVAFGVFHHIPSIELRAQFIKTICELANNSNSRIVLTAWQFASEDRFSHKFIDPEMIDLDPEQLESNDYILGWKNQPNTYRYCHFVDQSEMEEIVKIAGNCSIESSFLADGKTEKLNRYFVLQPKL